MIKLEIPRKDEPNMDLVDKLTELALAHSVRLNRKLKEAILTDGSVRLEGLKKINEYLLETEEELSKWWYCAC
ncbi:hypothetical protein [Lewinella sp. LCG006]|uniref:hypothetical protein n=1 Tax=Lewinella sp. LCG006 TaxID=3231911 RepID=UPI00345F995A